MSNNIPFKDAEAMFNGALQKAVDMPPSFVLLPQMVDLLLQKHRKDRSLNFVARALRPSYTANNNMEEYLTRVELCMGDDHLATLQMVEEVSYMPTILYKVSSPALARERPRKGRVETRNYRAAVRYLDKHVLPIGNADRYANERHSLENMRMEWRMEFVAVGKSINEQLRSVVSTASQFREVCSLLGASSVIYAPIEEQFNTLDSLGSLVNVNASYNYVHIHNGVCEVMSRDGQEVLKSYPANTLPPELARKIGMLKVASPEVLVKDIGVKKSDNTFIVIGGYDAR